MRLPEQRLWDRLSNNITRKDGILLTRIEALLPAGLPDVHCQSTWRNSCWIELKSSRWPVRSTSAVLTNSHGLRLDQKNWFLDHTNYEGKAFVLIGDENSDRHALIPGEHADKINGASIYDLVAMDGALIGIGNQFWHEMKAMIR